MFLFRTVLPVTAGKQLVKKNLLLAWLPMKSQFFLFQLSIKGIGGGGDMEEGHGAVIVSPLKMHLLVTQWIMLLVLL